MGSPPISALEAEITRQNDRADKAESEVRKLEADRRRVVNVDGFMKYRHEIDDLIEILQAVRALLPPTDSTAQRPGVEK